MLEQHIEQEALAAFTTAFPNENEQESILKKFFSQNRFYSLMPKEIARKQAIREWFENARKGA